MKKQSKLALALLISFPLVMFTSCGGNDDVEKMEEVVEAPVEEQQGNETYYQIPSPDEMFGFIKESGLAFNGELLNPIQNADKYVTPNRQALNFGIYSADLAYTASFEEFDKTIKYFGTIQKLADQIGISSAFDKALLERIQGSLDNVDSLVSVTNSSYFSVVEYLEKNEQGDKLGIIAVAGWIETVYVVANSANYKKDKAAIERLADQKLTLENLLDYLGKYSDNADVSQLLTSLRELEATYATLSEESSGSGISLKKKENGKMVLGGGSSIKITEDQFNAIKAKVSEIRNNIVNTEA
ncbi:MAG: hypothetical protein J5I47_10060 [Vicingus serpentipes]|nr:hypothetical protein [Vicingus serpentipes]